MDAVASAVLQQEGADGIRPGRCGGLQGVGELVGVQVGLDGLRLGAVTGRVLGDSLRQGAHVVGEAVGYLQGLPAPWVGSRAGARHG